MAERPSRADNSLRNRGALLAAARRVFLERGFHGATLEAIALDAGFSKGLVYSQFDSKGDLFLALVEQRRVERAATNASIVRPGSGGRGLLELMRYWDSRQDEDRAWTLLVMEFRVHAARDRTLAARYSELHERTLAGVVELLEDLYRDGPRPPVPMRTLAAFVLALGSGIALERTSDASISPLDEIAVLLGPSLDPAGGVAPRAASPAARKRRTA